MVAVHALPTASPVSVTLSKGNNKGAIATVSVTGLTLSVGVTLTGPTKLEEYSNSYPLGCDKATIFTFLHFF